MFPWIIKLNNIISDWCEHDLYETKYEAKCILTGYVFFTGPNF